MASESQRLVRKLRKKPKKRTKKPKERKRKTTKKKRTTRLTSMVSSGKTLERTSSSE